jgi:transposase-like protein
MDCPKCSGTDIFKSGKIKERQHYKCKVCGCNYTVEFKSTAYRCWQQGKRNGRRVLGENKTSSNELCCQ